MSKKYVPKSSTVRLKSFLRIIEKTEKEAIVTRKKTGWFDKETLLDRILKNIHRMRLLTGIPEGIKEEKIRKAFAVYLNVQGMNDKNELRDERRVSLRSGRDSTVNNFSDSVDMEQPMIYAHGLGYAIVNWKKIYAKREKPHDHYWKPNSGRRDSHGRLIDLADTQYWAFRGRKRGDSGGD